MPTVYPLRGDLATEFVFLSERGGFFPLRRTAGVNLDTVLHETVKHGRILWNGGEQFLYRYIFLDLDGTLTDSKEGILNSLRHAFEKLDKSVPGEDTLIKFIGPPLQETFMDVCGFTKEQAFTAVEAFRERYEPIGKFENAATQGMPELCGRLKEAGYVLALSSSKPETLCVDICGRFGYTPSLSVIAGSPLHGDHTKADVIRDTFRRLNLHETDRPHILMVGDRKYDVLGAKECGIDCVGVEFFGYAAPGELEEAGAVAVVRSAEELEQFILAH